MLLNRSSRPIFVRWRSLRQPYMLCGPPEAQLLNLDASVRDAATASLRKIRGIKAVPVIVHAWQVQRDRPVEFAKRQRSPSPPTEEPFVHFRKLSSELNQ